MSPSPALRTPRMRPLDNDNEVAQTILMLATPPTARAPSLPTMCTGRRLSFSRCQAQRPPKRPRHGDAEEEAPPALAAQTHVQPLTRFCTPNLSEIVALPQCALALSRLKRHAPSAAANSVLAPPK
ncbi:hypothetical protein GGI20_004168 [Coemansia sp. BCRC 34301]|nr:hypothetical protein GGI20_004168 [Coemansia sp. BCRC 34301]